MTGLLLQYCFPPQPIVIDSVSALVKTLVLGSSSTAAPPPTGLAGWVKRDESEEGVREREEKARIKGSKTLIAVGTYSIGKERIVKGASSVPNQDVFSLARLESADDGRFLIENHQASRRPWAARSTPTRASVC